MRFMALGVVLGCFMATSVADAGEVPAYSLQYRWNASVSSHYVGYLGYRLSEDPVVQNEMALTAGRLRAVAWWSAGTNDTQFSSDRADEVDLWVQWRAAYSSVTIMPELLYQCFYPLNESEGDALVPRLKGMYVTPVSLFHGGACTVSAQIESRFSLPTFDRRPTVTLGVSQAYPVTERCTWSVGGSALYDTGSRTADEGIIMQWRTECALRMSERCTGQVFWKRFEPLGIDVPDRREEETVFGVGITITF